MSDQEMEREIRGLFGLIDGLELQWINKPELGLATTFEAIFALILERWRPPTPAETTPEAPPALKAKSTPVPRVPKNRSQRIVDPAPLGNWPLAPPTPIPCAKPSRGSVAQCRRHAPPGQDAFQQ